MCRINILACLFITVLFWSCTEKTENTTTFSYTNDGKQVENIIIEAPKDTNYRYDSMLDRKYFYPIEKFLYTQFLQPGFYHDDSSFNSITKYKWTGLFTKNGLYYTDNSKVSTKRVFDGILDDDETGINTGWEIEALHKDTCIFLIGEEIELPLQKIQIASELTDLKILPGDTINFTFLNKQYMLYATANPDTNYNENYHISNYRLYLSGNKNGKQIHDMILRVHQFEDERFNIMLEGDFDGDNNLDLYFDVSGHYNVYHPVLYLSKPATENYLLEAVAGYERTGC